MRSYRVLPPFRHSPKKQSPAALLKLRTMGRHTFILYTDAHVRVYNPVLPWGANSASTLDSPSTWRHVFFVVYAFISLLSWTLWTRCPPPPPTPGPVVQPYSYPLSMKAGKYSWASTRDMRGIRNRQNKNGVQNDLSLFFFSFSSWIAPCVSSCLACKSFSCTAGRPLLAAVQLLTLLSPRKRKERRRGGQI